MCGTLHHTPEPSPVPGLATLPAWLLLPQGEGWELGETPRGQEVHPLKPPPSVLPMVTPVSPVHAHVLPMHLLQAFGRQRDHHHNFSPLSLLPHRGCWNKMGAASPQSSVIAGTPQEGKPESSWPLGTTCNWAVKSGE